MTELVIKRKKQNQMNFGVTDIKPQEWGTMRK